MKGHDGSGHHRKLRMLLGHLMNRSVGALNRQFHQIFNICASVAGVALGLVLIGQLPPSLGETPYSAWALAPPFIALGLAVGTRRPALSMFVAMLFGAALHEPSAAGVATGIWKYWASNLFDLWHVCGLAFPACLLGLVQVMGQSGGTGALLAVAGRYVHGRRGSKLGTGVAGLLVFFDDYANALMVGPALRPLTDRHGVSRQKLAYLVDSTAAPVAGLALMSTWVGYEVGLFQEVARSLGLSSGGYALLLGALPYRFYCLFALVLVFLSSAWERDFEPMLSAERRALERAREAHGPLGRDGEAFATDTRLWHNAAVPLAVLLVSVPLGLMIDGGVLSAAEQAPARLASLSLYSDSLMASQNNTVVLFVAGLLATAAGLSVPWVRRSTPASELGTAFARGVRASLPPLAILLSAWGLAAVCKELGTGAYLLWAVSGNVAGSLVPLVSFLMAALVAFFTGTSWGTMAIVVPAVAPLAHAEGGQGLLLVTLASVLDGAIFGDHCSPISDTTVMTSVATECDLVEHVKTQLPYALCAMTVAATCGYLLVPGGSVLLSYALGAAALTVTLWVLGRPLVPLRSK
jgi:Na+/H+ antiporter NhaC